MADHIEAIKTALRVLSAVTDRRTPDPADVAALRAFAPELATLPADDLACEIVQRLVASGSHRAAGA